MTCRICGRHDVRKRPRAGKQHYPHKCPHGIWCVSGSRLNGIHANHPPQGGPNYCEQCLNREGAR
jgi:hypothetical protein